MGSNMLDELKKQIKPNMEEWGMGFERRWTL